MKTADKDIKLQPETTGSETRDEEEFILTKELINVFIKTIKSFRLYPADNPTLVGMRDHLFKRFQNHLGLYNSMAIGIGEYEFSFQGKVLYEDRELKGSLPFLFYKDGLREIRFMEDLEEWELKGLADLIIQRDNVNEFEDDLITLMWEKDFIHISYTATDQFLEETPVLIPTTVEQFRQNATSDPMPESAKEDFLEGGPAGEFDLEKEVFGKGAEAGGPGDSVYSLSSEELESLRKEVEKELNPYFVFQVADVAFEILALEKEREAFLDAVKILKKLLDAQLEVGEFAKAKDLLGRVHLILNTYQLEEWQIQAIRRFVENLGDLEHTQRIGDLLEKKTDLPLEEVSGYLLLLKANAVPGLIKVLGDLSNSKGRRMLCDVVCQLAKGRTDLVIPYMEDSRWYLVRNLVYILGRVGEEASMSYIQKSYGHAEARVRREAVQAAGLIGGTRASVLLTKALKDPDLRIRSMAGISLARVGKKASLPVLLEVIQAKDFSKKDPSEAKAFLDAVGSIGSNEAIRPLQQILEHKSWFGGGTKDSIRLGAAYSLGLIGTAEAKAVLQSGAESKEEHIRQACLEAKRRLGI